MGKWENRRMGDRGAAGIDLRFYLSPLLRFDSLLCNRPLARSADTIEIVNQLRGAHLPPVGHVIPRPGEGLQKLDRRRTSDPDRSVAPEIARVSGCALHHP